MPLSTEEKRIELTYNETKNGTAVNFDVEMMYPDIYEKSPANRGTVTLGLCHVRAADDIRISYESDRDGWVIEQASKFTIEEGEDPDWDWQEVAFIQAWARERPSPSDD